MAQRVGLHNRGRPTPRQRSKGQWDASCTRDPGCRICQRRASCFCRGRKDLIRVSWRSQLIGLDGPVPTDANSYAKLFCVHGRRCWDSPLWPQKVCVKWELGPRCILQKDGRAKDTFFSGLEQFYLQSEMTPQGTLNFCRNGSNLPNKCFYFSCWGELVTFVKDNKPRGLHNQSGLDRGWFTHWASRDAGFYGVCQKSKVKCTIRLNALWCKNMFFPRAGPWEVCRFLKAL